MDISSRFPLVDFLAYLFPGIVDTLGIYLLLLHTPLASSLTSLQTDFFTGVLFVTLSYVLGVVISGPTEIFMQKERIKGSTWIKSIIPIPEFQDEIIATINNLIQKNGETKSEWTTSHFYFCRSLVLERMPHLAQIIDRQSSLRQLRMNLIPSIAIWLLVSIAQGIRELIDRQIVFGVSLIIIPILLWFPIVKITIERMNRNEEREVREVLTAFLAGYKLGLFDKKQISESK